jgi:hypothetical protein
MEREAMMGPMKSKRIQTMGRSLGSCSPARYLVISAFFYVGNSHTQAAG